MSLFHLSIPEFPRMFFFIEFDSRYLTNLAFKQEAYCTRKFQKPHRILLKDTFTRAYIYFESIYPKCYFCRPIFFLNYTIISVSMYRKYNLKIPFQLCVQNKQLSGEIAVLTPSVKGYLC